ncbi:hypothetical protein RZS08_14565, partial [Arthrospira platensis SPKY1]|nr:hypothetical protein [Arthrospira platensis SPKY1]
RVSNIQTLTSNRSASALAIATAINSQTALTGVTATALGATTQGDTITRGVTTGVQSLYLNGIEVKVDFGVGTTVTDRINEVVKQVNQKIGEHGVQATKTANGALNLTTVDGRNLSVWFNSPTASPLSASEFGLGVGGSTPAAGVIGADGAGINYTAANTVY